MSNPGAPTRPARIHKFSFGRCFSSRRTLICCVLVSVALSFGQPGLAIEEAAPSAETSSATPARPPRVDQPTLTNGIKKLLAGKHEEALTLFEKFNSENPQEAEGYFWLGTALSETGRSEKAMDAYQQAIKLNDRDGVDVAQLRVNLGNVLLGMDKTDEAITQFLRAVRLDPSEPRAYFNLSRAYLHKGSPFLAALALSDLDKAEKLGLKLTSMHKFRAEAYMLLHMNERARSELERYLKELAAQGHNPDTKAQIKDLIADLTSAPPAPEGPVPAKRRRYTLDHEQAYIVVDTDDVRRTILLTSSDQKDPDGGLQDGVNDGFFEMTMEDFRRQLGEGGSVWKRKE